MAPADCGFHPTAPDAVDPIAAPALPPRPAADAPAADQVTYWTIRSQRGELGGLQMKRERDAAEEARARNAVPQEACASWFDSHFGVGAPPDTAASERR